MAPIPIPTAALAAVQRFRDGAIDAADGICDQILAVDARHPQSLLLKLWIARRSGDPAAVEAAAKRLAGALPADADVPLVLPRQPGPRLADADLAALFDRDTPPVSDISDHLPTLFWETVVARPRLIVELGTRGGESTRALLAAAVRSGARMLSIDIDPCGGIPGLPEAARRAWTFVQHDDVAFGRERFAGWCRAAGLEPRIDVLFIDTSHLYEHTREELAVWLPLVAPQGTVLLHDTAMGVAYLRADASIGIGWDNERGVIRALEERFGRRWDETRPFIDSADGWIIRHDPRCSGFTVLRRMG